MIEKSRPKINLTRTLPMQNEYTLALDNELKEFAFNEERAPLNKGHWRKLVFHAAENSDYTAPMDLEIGTGSGMHFAFHANKYPTRLIVGLELKYKPLIQSIRRAHAQGLKNSAICRYHAFNVDLLFAEQELDNIYIHFPDPWVTPRKPRNRVVNQDILNVLFNLQKSGSFLEFKTDSREYFLWALEEIKKTNYKTEFQTLNLYGYECEYETLYKKNNFQTSFEKIFVKQGIEINYIKLLKVTSS